MATQSTVSSTPVAQVGSTATVPATTATVVGGQTGGLWQSARQLFAFAAPKLGKDGDFTFAFLTSPQRAKPAATVNADNFYMYACGSINMP